MKISGFSFVRNVSKLYYPFEESIRSILDLVDEFVIAVGEGDPDDNSLERIQAIGSEKIRIVHTVWDLEKYRRKTELAHQTDIAKEHCSGDWLFYIQGDEVVHEDDIDAIRKACQNHLDNTQVDGFLFKYLHFWGDYDHYFRDHCWYPWEIRIIRNDPDIHSFRDAQSFRRVPQFEGWDYYEKEGTSLLNVVKLNARIFHYGWVRPPSTMQKKKEYFSATEKGVAAARYEYSRYQEEFDYGRMDRTRKFRDTHPAVMKSKIAQHDWSDSLRFSGPAVIGRDKAKHEKTKYRIIMWIEKYLLGGRLLGGFRNYRVIDPR